MSDNGTEKRSKVLPPVPLTWQWTTLGELSDIVSGVTKGQRHADPAILREVPYLRVANVQRGFFDLSEIKTIRTTEEKIEKLRLQAGDVLFNEGGDRDKLGRGWVWNGEIDDCIHQNHVFRARLVKGIDPKFVSFHANFFGQEWFWRHGKQSVNLASINQTVLRQFPVPIAPTNEQRRIVAKLDELFSDLDAGVAALERAKANLKRYRAAVLKAAVEGRLTEEWREQHPDVEPASELLKRILTERRRKWEADKLAEYERKGKKPPKNWKDKYQEPAAPDTANLPELPDGWCWARVNQVGKVQLGRQRSPKHHHGPHMRPYLRVANVFEDRIDISDVMEMNFTPDEYKRYKLEHGDILLNEGQSFELIGRPAMYRDEVPGACFTNTLVRFRTHGELDPDYALRVFLAYLKNGRFQKIASITVNLAHLGAGRFAEIEFPVPPLAEQRKIVEIVDHHFSLIDASNRIIEASLARASRLRQSILKRAFEGKLVAQDPTDESAAKLLDGIHCTS